ncbi:MAG: hypothetical protein HYY18_00940 [Planctomycetes bacterium]|nr:hypothetical protein [Planctomycetota bacterium]
MKTLLIILALLGDWEEACENADPQTRDRVESVDNLSQDITLLNLVNGLNLSKAQMTRVIALSREAQAVRDETFRKNGEKIREYESALRELRETLAAGGRIPRDLEVRVQSREAELKNIKMAYFERLRAIETRLREGLSAAQIGVIEPFNPCIIPPQELKDPVRVGQSASETRDLEDALYTIRAIPEKSWKPVATAIFEMFLSFEEHILGAFEPAKRASEIERLLLVGERARGLTDEEFEVEKGKLAVEVIQPIHDFQYRAQELQADFMRAAGGLSKTGKYLLNPRIVPILEERLALKVDGGRTDLDGIDPAESCESCGEGEKTAKKPTLENLGPEPRFELFAAWLGLNGEQSGVAREAIGTGMVELLSTLAAPREDGRNILREFLLSLIGGKENEAMVLMGGTFPGEDLTYWQKIVGIKTRVDAKLEACLDEEQFAKYRSANIDIFKIKGTVGSRK